MTVLRVAVPTPLRTLLDYLPAPGAVPPPGVRVRVPLGRRDAVGVVLEHAQHSELAPGRLRAVRAVLDETALLPADLLALARWAADYYQHPIGEVVAQMLPAMARRARPATGRRAAGLELTAAGRAVDPATLLRAPIRRRALELLAAAESGRLALTALAARGVSGAVARAIVAEGWARRVELTPTAAGGDAQAPTEPPTPSTEQAAAVAAIDGGRSGFRALLLDGVTGSGKTEVYFAAMRAALDAGRQVLLLVPEIGLTPQTLGRVRRRFPEPIAVLHSGLPDGERMEAFRAARAGRARIVLGTRSAVFAPLPDAGLIVVDEEHDDSYKQQDGFRYSARDLAVKRASLLGLPVVLGSATPSLASLANVRAGRYRQLRLTQRVAGARMPPLELVDTSRHEAPDGLSTPLLRAMHEALGRDEQVLLFINRRGFAPVLMCRSCAWIAECPRCDARLTVHARPESLRCHHCGWQQALPSRCPTCGDVEPLPVGVGTQRTEQALGQHFPGVPVVRIDRDTTRSSSRLEDTFAGIQEERATILVGTQMIAKGHHFPRVTLAGVIGADGAFFSADFRAGERQAQILVQVAGRAGRAERPGRVLIQTRHPEHPLLQTLLAGGYAAWAEAALEERRALGLPPYGHLALLRAEAVDRALPERFLGAAAARLRDGAGSVSVLGPVPALMPRRQGRERMQLLLQAGDRRSLHRLLAATMPALDALPDARRVRWSLDVDPLDTL
ncbi:MAG: primosomal protein N' [Pseudomonadales bacterium]|nr:primosomal protein N' [Pseudomonadales bacterium]